MKRLGTSELLCMLLLVICTGAFCAADVLSEPKNADFFISPDGDDNNPGTRDKPFATLNRARDAIRKISSGEKNRDIRVLLRGGEYFLDETVVFSLKDSASKGHTITYAAFPGEKPVFHSGIPVTGWRKLEDVPADLPAVARKHIYVAPIPRSLERFYTLYDGSERLPRARGHGFRQTNKWKGYHVPDQNTMTFPEGVIKDGSNVRDWEIVVITAGSWSMDVLPIETIDLQKNTLRTGLKASYALSPPPKELFEETAWFENTLFGLDEPGEWVLDTAQGLIYLWPIDGEPCNNIIAPSLTEFIRVEGDIDYAGPVDQPVRGLVFDGLTFTHADRYTWKENGTGYGLQHDWEAFDRPSAMIRLRGAEECAVANCQFTNSGATAIRLDLHSQDNRIIGNKINHLGGAGIVLAGYGPGVKDVNRNNQVVGNQIHNIGEIFWHSPGIFAWQSGANLIANNLIHNTPYTGIVVSGRITWSREKQEECSQTIRWKEVEKIIGVQGIDYNGWPDWETREQFLHGRNNLIVRNELHNVMEVLSDGNAIYVSGAGKGNIVRENYVHDCPSRFIVQAIRCDDDQHETIIDRNIISKIGGWSEYIIIKGRNYITGNIMASPLNAPKRGMLVLKPDDPGGTDGSIVAGNIFYANRANDIIYGELFDRQNKRKGLLANCRADKNVYFNTKQRNWAKAHLKVQQARGRELNSISEDPAFVGISEGQFGYRENSPVTDLGITPIDISLIGLPNSKEDTACRQQVPDRPNIIFIFADDVGWGDLSCYGNPDAKTTALDQLASEGTLFTHFYVPGSVCSPSRVGIMTGQYPARHRVFGHYFTPALNSRRNMPNELDSNVFTLTDMLQSGGYVTGHFGKWHLGYHDPSPHSEYGIDVYQTNKHSNVPGKDILDFGSPEARPVSSKRIIDASLDFIREHHDKPFYANVWLFDTHATLNPSKEQLAEFERFAPESKGVDFYGIQQVYLSTLVEMDRQIGRLLKELDKMGLSENTLVIFSSDNGPEDYAVRNSSHSGAGKAGPFRGRKRSLYEGGIRVPFILRWPGHVPAGVINETTALNGVDFMATFSALTDISLPQNSDTDGVDMLDAWLGDQSQRKQPMFWEWRQGIFGHPLHHSPMIAVRKGKYKLLLNPDRSRVELYNVVSDPSELQNLTISEPDRTSQMTQLALDWYKTLPPGPVVPGAGSVRWKWPDNN